MSEQVFADGIGPIVVVGGTVRLDFITLVPDEGEGGARPKPVVQHRLFMPIDAFQIAARRFAEAASAIVKLEQQQAGAKPATVVAPAAELHPVAPPPTRPAVLPEDPAPASDRPKSRFP